MTSPHIHPDDRSGSVEEGRFRGERAITLAAGDLERHVPARPRHDRCFVALEGS